MAVCFASNLFYYFHISQEMRIIFLAGTRIIFDLQIILYSVMLFLCVFSNQFVLIYEPCREKTCLRGFLVPATQPQKMARGLKFQLEKVEG